MTGAHCILRTCGGGAVARKIDASAADMRYNGRPLPGATAMLEFQDGHCPYCGEPVDLPIDASAGSQRYIEDCPVCCKPMTVVLEVGTDGASPIQLLAQDEA